MNEERTFRRGEVYLANLGFGYGSEQGGIRPVVVLQNNIGNIYCPTLIVAPLTSKISKKASQPTHYQISGDGRNIRPSTVLLEQITTIDKRRIMEYRGRLSCGDMDEMKECIFVSLGISIPDEVEAP